MTQVLVSVFDSFQEAEQAAERLVQRGLDWADIELQGSGQTDAEAERTVLADQGVSSEPQEAGVFGKIEHFFGSIFGSDDRPLEVGHYQEAVRRGGALLTVNVIDDAHVAMIRSTLHEAGAVDFDQRVAQWKSTGYEGFDATATPYTADETAADKQAFPVVRESLDVGKQEVETGGVRVYSRVTETPVTETVNLREEHATIERRPVDRVATAADLNQGSIEIRETAEHAVVAKTAHVVEEVVVGRQATERTETINETLHGTEVEVERVDGDLAAEVRSAGSLGEVPPVKPV